MPEPIVSVLDALDDTKWWIRFYPGWRKGWTTTANVIHRSRLHPTPCESILGWCHDHSYIERDHDLVRLTRAGRRELNHQRRLRKAWLN